jgi:uncharacterized protein
VQIDDIVTINSRKYDRTIRRSWTCRFISWEDSLLVFEGEFESEVSHSYLGVIAAGTRSLEYYWLDRWYNVFRFYEPSGEFRNLYCNMNMPPVFENGVLDYVDLDIDVVAWPDGMTKVLDEDDFEANAERYDYPESVRTAALEALEEIKLLISKGLDVFSPS